MIINQNNNKYEIRQRNKQAIQKDSTKTNNKYEIIQQNRKQIRDHSTKQKKHMGLLNRTNKRSRPFAFSSVLEGFNKSAQSAGVSDSATKAESTTEIAIVMANC